MSATPNDGWFKSSYSGDPNGNCVEARYPAGQPVNVRDSKQFDEPSGYTVLSFSQAAWSAFTAHTSGR
ncbi:hypothetical protein ADK90_10915 [Streptomyces sp. XY413]|uniref:DUF397 domain-containing protein n=1 Tax=Streptomyces sp. XY413 TaxID=1519479 RepID=UPI0006AE0C40|nr:DUF397 domain-containing protein [Streptomyces sp. XY413]KOV22535.1 hypothetical protein ADK90_10915 [Streptomyces sp. XY413]